MRERAANGDEGCFSEASLILAKQICFSEASLNQKTYAGIYADIASQIDSKTAERIYEILRGQKVTFPQKLYSVEYVHAFIREHQHFRYS